MPSDLRSEFGDIDIYLFDLLLRGHLHPSMTVLDAGCGTGRNLRYLLRNGFTVYAADLDAASVEAVQALAARVSSSLPQTNFRVEPIEAMSFPDECADLVISSAVLPG
jgi:SAM-dependent methyltransferase